MRVSGALAVCACACAACGRSGPTAPAADAGVDAVLVLPDARAAAGDPCAGPIALDDLGRCLDLAWCARLEACGWGLRDGADCSDLPDAIGDVPLARDLADAVRADTTGQAITYDPSAARACVDAVGAASCKTVAPGGAIPLACAAIVGQRGEFGLCNYGFECVDGTICSSDPGIPLGFDVDVVVAACGVRTCLSPAALGAPCSTQPCDDGAHCTTFADGPSCSSGDPGAGCNADADCDDGAWCDDGGVTRTDGSGMCRAAGDAGAACARDRQCAGELRCVGEGLAPPAGTCVDTSAPGAPCDDLCSGAMLCATPVAGALGACVAAPEVGAPCVPGAGCGAFLRCDDRGTPDPGDDVCAPRPVVGEPCATGGCAAGLFCTSEVSGTSMGVCTAPLEIGTGCRDASQCASGACTSSFCAVYTACPD